jgi:hypothetical protein
MPGALWTIQALSRDLVDTPSPQCSCMGLGPNWLSPLSWLKSQSERVARDHGVTHIGCDLSDALGSLEPGVLEFL